MQYVQHQLTAHSRVVDGHRFFQRKHRLSAGIVLQMFETQIAVPQMQLLQIDGAYPHPAKAGMVIRD